MWCWKEQAVLVLHWACSLENVLSLFRVIMNSSQNYECASFPLIKLRDKLWHCLLFVSQKIFKMIVMYCIENNVSSLCSVSFLKLWFLTQILLYEGVVDWTTYNKELESRLLGCCSVGFLGFDDNLDLIIWQPGLQLFSVFLSLHLPIWSPLLEKQDKVEEVRLQKYSSDPKNFIY